MTNDMTDGPEILTPEVLRIMLRNMAVEAVRTQALLREARDWIARELQATEVELPDAEDLVIRMGQVLGK